MFRRAGCIVGPQGSGLANMLWSRAGIKVAEVFAPAFATQRADWTLASALGHGYLAAVAEDAEAYRAIHWSRDQAREVLAWAAS
jgi:capsular polysaccharide biosynthesis protein